MKDFVMAVEDKAAKHRLHHGVSQGHIYPNKRLVKKHYEHLLPHVLGMPSYMAEGKDAHISLQQGGRSNCNAHADLQLQRHSQVH